MISIVTLHVRTAAGIGIYQCVSPVCFSFKPGQEEFVWQERLDWEFKRHLQQEIAYGKQG